MHISSMSLWEVHAPFGAGGMELLKPYEYMHFKIVNRVRRKLRTG